MSNKNVSEYKLIREVLICYIQYEHNWQELTFLVNFLSNDFQKSEEIKYTFSDWTLVGYT